MANLEMVGQELVAKGAADFISKMREANKASEQFLNTLEKTAKKPIDIVPKDAEKRLMSLRSGLASMGKELLNFRGGLGGVGPLMSSFRDTLGQIDGMSLKVAASIAVLAVATLGFFKLGAHGAQAEGVVFSFSRIADVAQTTSDELLGAMRKAAAGTVADLDLMKRANLAMAGATGQVAQEMGKNLPKLLEIARAQARATGQDVNFLFDSIVTGVKRSSPMLIDNTGIVLKVGSANEKMAAKLGISVDALTDEDKQLAVLNATLEAGQRAIDLYGTKTRTAAEMAAGFKVQIANTLDRLSLALQPLYTLILSVGDALLSSILWPLNNFIIPILYELSKAIFGPVLNAWNSFKEAISTGASPAINFLKELLTSVVAVIRLLGKAWSWLVEQVGKALKPILDLAKAFVQRLFGKHLSPQKFFEGGARALGALAAGMLHALNAYILPALIFIAQTIADFLSGMSPPPEGPLSTIDKGGANTMLAWLEGFTGVSLDPVKDVAANVNAALGGIAVLGLQQVEDRIAVLDQAIQPFEERLKIIQSRMDAILNPLKQIEGVLNRRLDTALGDFFGGKGDADSVRALDQQKAALTARMDNVQAIGDEAAYQLSLKQLEQVGERNLLEIQLARLKAVQQEQTAVEKTTDAKAEAEKKAKEAKGGGGADAAAADAAGLGGGGNLPADPVAAFLGIDEEAVQKSMDGIVGAFNDGFADAGGGAGLAEAKKNVATLKTQMDRIGESSGLQKIKNAFNLVFGTGEGSIIGTITSFADTVQTKWNQLWDDLGNAVNKVPGIIAGGLVGIGSTVYNLLTQPFALSVQQIYDAIFGGGRGATFSLMGLTVRVSTGLEVWLGAVGGVLDDALVKPFSTGITAVDALLFGGGRGTTLSLMGLTLRIPPGITTWLGPLSEMLIDSLQTPFATVITEISLLLYGASEGSLMTLLLQVPAAIPTWLNDLLRQLTDSMLTPVLTEIALIYNALFGPAGSLMAHIKSLPGQIVDWLKDLPTKLKEALTDPFEKAVNDAKNFIKSIPLVGGIIPSSNTTTNQPTPKGAATGAHARARELFVTGEKGWEFFRPDVPGTIIPHDDSVRLLKQMQQPSNAMMRVLAGPQATMRTVAGPSTVNNSTSNSSTANVTNNFKLYGQQSLRLAMAQAQGWKK